MRLRAERGKERRTMKKKMSQIERFSTFRSLTERKIRWRAPVFCARLVYQSTLSLFFPRPDPGQGKARRRIYLEDGVLGEEMVQSGRGGVGVSTFPLKIIFWAKNINGIQVGLLWDNKRHSAVDVQYSRKKSPALATFFGFRSTCFCSLTTTFFMFSSSIEVGIGCSRKEKKVLSTLNDQLHAQFEKKGTTRRSCGWDDKYSSFFSS